MQQNYYHLVQLASVCKGSFEMYLCIEAIIIDFYIEYNTVIDIILVIN